MGYTHYWNVREDTPSRKLIGAAQQMLRVVEATTVPLGAWDGNTEFAPDLNNLIDGSIRFNGVKEDAHETFIFGAMSREKYLGIGPEGWAFAFCKTAQKPYDVVVVACLLVAQKELGDAIEISSDAMDWNEFVGREQSPGWLGANQMLGHPQGVDHPEDAVQLYERVFGEAPPVPPHFKVAEEVQ